MLPDVDCEEGIRLCLQAELPEAIHFKVGQSIRYVVADTGDMLDVNLNIMLHSKECEGRDQSHHGFVVDGGLGHDVDH